MSKSDLGGIINKKTGLVIQNTDNQNLHNLASHWINETNSEFKTIQKAVPKGFLNSRGLLLRPFPGCGLTIIVDVMPPRKTHYLILVKSYKIKLAIDGDLTDDQKMLIQSNDRKSFLRTLVRNVSGTVSVYDRDSGEDFLAFDFSCSLNGKLKSDDFSKNSLLKAGDLNESIKLDLFIDFHDEPDPTYVSTLRDNLNIITPVGRSINVITKMVRIGLEKDNRTVWLYDVKCRKGTVNNWWRALNVSMA